MYHLVHEFNVELIQIFYKVISKSSVITITIPKINFLKSQIQYILYLKITARTQLQ